MQMCVVEPAGYIKTSRTLFVGQQLQQPGRDREIKARVLAVTALNGPFMLKWGHQTCFPNIWSSAAWNENQEGYNPTWWKISSVALRWGKWSCKRDEFRTPRLNLVSWVCECGEIIIHASELFWWNFSIFVVGLRYMVQNWTACWSLTSTNMKTQTVCCAKRVVKCGAHRWLVLRTFSWQPNPVCPRLGSARVTYEVCPFADGFLAIFASRLDPIWMWL